MEIQGYIKHIGAIEYIGTNGFQKRDLVITTAEQYPQPIIIQFTQGRCALLDNLQLGQKVNVHFNLRGREWISPQGEAKYFNTVEGWKIKIIQVTNVANQGYQVPSYQNPVYQNPQQPTQTQMFDNNGQTPTNQQGNNQKEDELDLPF